MNYIWLNSFNAGTLKFKGAFCFSNNKGYNYLLSRDGGSIFIDDCLLENLKKGIISEEFSLKLLVHGLVEISNIHHCYSDKCFDFKKNKPSIFVIDITKACNLKCIYCFRDLKDRESINMKTLNDVCDFIDRNAISLELHSISIQLWGGEPLLAMDRIRFVDDYFKNKTYLVKIDIETNATLITRQIAKELYERKISVGVSVDGDEIIQNLHRPLENGKPSSELVKSGIDNLRSEYGNYFGGICVVTKHNYRFIPEILNYFVNVLGLHSVKFNLVRDNPNALNKKISLNAEEIKEFAEILIKSLKTYAMLGVEFSEGNLFTKYQNLTEGSHGDCCISRGCTGGIRILSFDREGGIFPCEMTDFPAVRIGSIYSTDDLGTMINKSYKNNPFFRVRKKQECFSCPWWCFCRGGCSSRTYYLNQTECVDETECLMNKTIYPLLVEYLLNKGTGIAIL